MLLASAWPAAMSVIDTDNAQNWGINEQLIASVLTPSIHKKQYPDTITLPSITRTESLSVDYTIDNELQKEAQRLLGKYNPDYGIIVALDPETGHILAMADSARDGLDHGNLSLINTYPAASISKIITAVAAVNENKASQTSMIPFNGKSTTLYKKNVFEHKKNKWTRNQSLTQSFGKSVNSVFGRLGAVDVGGELMMDYARRLGFNGRFASDFEFDNGHIELDIEDRWQVAEMASGYTRKNTLSPLHGAVLAAATVNGGNLVAPILVKSLTDPYGIPLYVNETPGLSPAMTNDTANQVKIMMQATVKSGSAKKRFRKFHRGDMIDVIAGGKTGSLTGFKPRGKYDWFVGFGEKQGKKIAYAVLCINKQKWYVKSAQLAREVLEYYFDPDKNPNLKDKQA